MRLFHGSLVFLFIVLNASCGNDPKENKEDSRPPHDSVLSAQSEPPVGNFAAVDVSPMDMSYFPVDYPKLKMANNSIAPPVARVIYSRPHLGNRRLFPDILKHGEAWRLGANEATELDLYKDVSILGGRVKAGRYNMYCVPQIGKWTIVLNSNLDTWGLKQDSTLDLYRFNIPITTGLPVQEFFTMEFEKTPKGCNLDISWDDVSGKLPLVF
ncbi:MAG: DUF2911 domain-containing protein [Chitinophagaceae bacterium]